jgi:hypothetical protein
MTHYTVTHAYTYILFITYLGLLCRAGGGVLDHAGGHRAPSGSVVEVLEQIRHGHSSFNALLGLVGLEWGVV